MSDALDKSLHDPGRSSLASGGVVLRYAGSSGGRSSRLPLAGEFSGPAAHQEVSQRYGDTVTSHIDIVKWLVRKAGFLKEVAKAVTLDLRRSAACLYRGKWCKFFRWCCRRYIYPCKAILPQMAELFYLWRELKQLVPAVIGLKLLVPAGNGCQATRNHVFSGWYWPGS